MAKETTYEEIARDLKNRIYKPVYYLMGEGNAYELRSILVISPELISLFIWR